MFCKKCGTKIEDGQRFCKSCGTPVAPAPQAPVNPQAQAPRPAAQQFTPPAQPTQQYAQPAPAPAAGGANAVKDTLNGVLSNPTVSKLHKQGWLHYGVVILLLFICLLMVTTGKVWHVGNPEISEREWEYLSEYGDYNSKKEYYKEMEKMYNEQIRENPDEVIDEVGCIPQYPYGNDNTIKNVCIFNFQGDIKSGGINALVFFVYGLPYILSILLMLVPVIPGVKLNSMFMWLMRPLTFWNLGSFAFLLLGSHIFFTDEYNVGVSVSFWGVLYIILVLGAFVLSFIAGSKINAVRKAEQAAAAPVYPYGQPYGNYNQPQAPYNQYQQGNNYNQNNRQ